VNEPRDLFAEKRAAEEQAHHAKNLIAYLCGRFPEQFPDMLIQAAKDLDPRPEAALASELAERYGPRWNPSDPFEQHSFGRNAGKPS
jgi:hypothetical protein